MDKTFKNRFKKFLDIALDDKLSIIDKIRKFIGKEDKDENLEITFNKKDSKEDFDRKIDSLTSDKIKVESNHLASVFCLLIQTELSTNYKDKTLTLLEKVNEKDIINTFDYVVKYDNLVMCEVFLNNTDHRYKNILSTNSDYSHHLCLSVEHGSAKVTEYFLKNSKFSDLLSDKTMAGTLLQYCLVSNYIEIANMLLSHDINLSAFKDEKSFKDESGNYINWENNELYKPEVIKQIKKRLLHEELREEFTENAPILSKPAKRMKL